MGHLVRQTGVMIVLLLMGYGLPDSAVAQVEAAPAKLAPPRIQFEATPRVINPEMGRLRDPKVVFRAARALTLMAVQVTAAKSAPVDGDKTKSASAGGHGHSDRTTQGLLVAMTSQDGGDSFTEPVLISKRDANVVGSGENSPSLVLGRKGMCAIWEQTRPGGGTDLMCSQSSMGNRWSEPVKVTDKEEASANSYANLTVAPNGDVWAVWLDGRNRTAGTLDVYAARSTDGGATFGKNLLVAKGACPCCRPGIAVLADGSIHIAWRGVSAEDIRDILLASSRDNGVTFVARERIAADNWQVLGCPHTGPALAAVGNTLHVAWYSESTGGDRMGVRWTQSKDGAKTFTTPIILSRGTLDANHPALSVSGDGRVYVVFQARAAGQENDWGPFLTWISEVTNHQTATLPPQSVSSRGPVSYPVALADTAGRLWTLWSQPETAQVFMARGRIVPAPQPGTVTVRQ